MEIKLNPDGFHMGIGLLWLMDKAAEKFDVLVCEPMLQKHAQAYNVDHDELLMAAWNHSRYSSFWGADDEWEFWKYQYFDRSKVHKNEEARIKRFEAWKIQNPNWETILAEIVKKKKEFFLAQAEERARLRMEREKAEAEEAARLERRKVRRQKTFTWIAKNTKWFAYTIALGVVCLMAYFSLYVYKFAADHFYWDRFVYTMLVIGIVIGIIAILLGLGFLGYKISDRCKEVCASCKFTWLTKSLSYVGKFFLMIGNFLSFMWNGAIMFKKEYCPGIIWEEKK